mgnify:CR=1 FL=1
MLNSDSIININTIIGEKTEKLDSIYFKDIVITDTATIGELIVQLPFGTILFPNGSINNIPDLPNVISNDTTYIDASDYFETMTLHDGDLTITITNNFPTDISNISFTLINQNTQNIIASFYFPIISSGTSDTNQYLVTNLEGTTMYYWRVKSKNNCTESSFSTVFSFTTAVPSYCTSTFIDENGVAEFDYIMNVTFNGINNILTMS